jgi:hypothetical protein
VSSLAAGLRGGDEAKKLADELMAASDEGETAPAIDLACDRPRLRI